MFLFDQKCSILSRKFFKNKLIGFYSSLRCITSILVQKARLTYRLWFVCGKTCVKSVENRVKTTKTNISGSHLSWARDDFFMFPSYNVLLCLYVTTTELESSFYLKNSVCQERSKIFATFPFFIFFFFDFVVFLL